MNNSFFFRKVFISEFNKCFSSPVSDSGAKCTGLKYSMKTDKPEEKRREHNTEKTIHLKRTNTFHELMREDIDSSLCFCLLFTHYTIG